MNKNLSNSTLKINNSFKTIKENYEKNNFNESFYSVKSTNDSPDDVLNSFGLFFIALFLIVKYKKDLGANNLYIFIIWILMGTNWTFTAMPMMINAFLVKTPCSNNTNCIIENESLSGQVYKL